MRLPFFAASVLLAAGLLLVSCDKPAANRSVTPATNAPSAASEASPRFNRLLGRWERPDGGYVLGLQSVDLQGKFEATYSNPGPIHVERAQALSENGATKLFVVLRDVNYPGCTYSLVYDEKADQFSGQYFQVSQQQTYDVTFVRLPAQP